MAYSIMPESGQGSDLVAHETEVAPALTAIEGERTTERGVRVVAATLTASQHPSSPNRRQSDEYNLVYRKSQRAHSEDDSETWVEDEVANTLNPHDLSSARSTELVASPGRVRRLTPTEWERLQGFPDDWTDVEGVSESARYRMLGNAVATPVAAWIGRRMAALS